MNAAHKDLKVWQRSMDMVVHLYHVTNSMPREEIYGLTSQMRRAAVSIPSNIAEGKSRGGDKEFYHFLRIADGSLNELKTQLEISHRLKFLREDQYDDLIAYCDEIGRMLCGLLR